MKPRIALLASLAAAVLLIAGSATALVAQSLTDKSGILETMNKSVEDWNRGDIDAFAQSYKNSPDILFIGRHIEHGYEGMLAGYKAAYPTAASMGKLSFTDLEVQPLDERFATATGWFHLVRSAKNGGNSDGYFLLVLEKTDAGWKIVRDDTTSVPAVKK